MHESIEHQAPKVLVDEYGNFHQITDELARGGQGVVYRTKDADLAVKQPLDASGQPDKTANLRERFQRIRLLPMPRRIPVSLPLAILRDEPGYVMRLLNDMKPFAVFDLDGRSKKKLEDEKQALPQWLAKIPDKDQALRLLHYASTGSTRRRLRVLAKCAAILARLHNAGMVYGDGDDAATYVGDLYGAAQASFEKLLAGRLPPDASDTQLIGMAESKAVAADLCEVLPESLRTVKTLTVRQTLQGGSQSLGACAIALLLVSDEDALAAIHDTQPTFVGDMANLIIRRGHGNEPLPLPKAKIAELRKAAFSTIKTLLEQ